MSGRRHVILFSSRFAAAVASGAKPHTIRPPRKREIRIGDELDLRAWAGKPYRSKQRKLSIETCYSVRKIVIRMVDGALNVTLGKNAFPLRDSAVEALARRDGFASVAEMAEWFQRMHGLPFVGVLIHWGL